MAFAGDWPHELATSNPAHSGAMHDAVRCGNVIVLGRLACG
jgi:hypothetical protein